MDVWSDFEERKKSEEIRNRLGMAQNAHLSNVHNVQSEKVRDGVISRVKFTKFVSNAKLQPNVKVQ